MSFVVSLKAVRLLLAVCVSVWLAGGCLLGCGSATMAAESDRSSQTAIEGESCHTASAHDCCAKPKPSKQNTTAKPNLPAKQNTIAAKLTESFLSLTSVPQGMMSDCPLAVSATAVAAKYNSNSPDATQATNAERPLMAASGELPQKHLVAPLMLNRGPTYLRCCAFLI